MWILALYAACLFGATVNHAWMLWQHGLFWDYGGVPRTTQAYWTSLTFVDPAAIMLLFVRPVAGIWLTLVIIVSDVVHNTWFGFTHGQPAKWMFYSQVVFLAFVLLTLPAALRGLKPAPP